MSRDDILAMARKAGLQRTNPGEAIEIVSFAAMVAAAEREAVASMIESGDPPPQDHGNRVEIGSAARSAYAAAIRARDKRTPWPGHDDTNTAA